MINLFIHTLGGSAAVAAPVQEDITMYSVLRVSDVTSPSLYWLQAHKSYDWPEITTTKPYFFLWSTDHHTGVPRNVLGQVWWGEADAPDLTGFVERGMLFIGEQIETPWLARGLNGLLHLYTHRETPSFGTSFQQTKLYTTTGGILHQATWTDRGYVLGLVTANQDNHTGYCRVWEKHPENPAYAGPDKYIAHHLTKSILPIAQYYSISPDGIAWARREQSDALLSVGMPSGYTFSMEQCGIFRRSGQNYAVGIRSGSTKHICIIKLDADLRPMEFVRDLTDHMSSDLLSILNVYFEGTTAHIYFKGTTVPVSAGRFEPYNYKRVSLTNIQGSA
ncbi:hypothetical protein FVR03_01400 [Pontibacter qinzhouensis]|uniref:Uncharacterized protein n=1 Tax=Pontibacter qinzhouensis TaxID=2603253 RepID=A0A5C8KDA9_9BACT|nr:hypothetical protein [Pontibacter qinzhouensis]TXK52400.1 hypothetical protein FVR03_01400 [Pontibacter qinzhouensis]